MCLESEDWEKCFKGTQELSYEELIKLDHYYQKHSESSIDDELHHIVKLVLIGKATQIKGLEKCLFLSHAKNNLFLKLGNIAKSLLWLFSRKSLNRTAKRELVEDDDSSSCILLADEEWNL